MPRRSFKKSRRPYRRARPRRVKRLRISAMPRINGIQDLKTTVHKFKRTFTMSAVAAAGSGHSFTLDQLNNYTDFTNLYDQYMICGIKVTFVPQYTEVTATRVPSTDALTYATMPRLVVAVSRDDITAPTEAQILERAYKKIWLMNRPRSIYFKPSLLSETYRNGVTTAYSIKMAGWIDNADVNVQHFGLLFFQSQGDAANKSIIPYVTYYLKCRAAR